MLVVRNRCVRISRVCVAVVSRVGAVGAMVTAVLAVSSAVGVADNAPSVLAAMPAVGGPQTLIQLHFDSDGVDDAYGPDFLNVDGPTGTSCAGSLASGGVRGPNSDWSGPVSVYIGPQASRTYPRAGDNAFDIATNYARPLTRWCVGTYTGTVTFLGGPGTTGLDATFRFSIVADRVTKVPTTVARHTRVVTVVPAKGHPTTRFAVRYRADATPFDSGDVVEVDGPKGSACRGAIVRAAAGGSRKRSGPVTLHIGPRAAYAPHGDNGIGKPLRRWCTGTYNGTIFYEHGPKFTVVARFKLHVTK